MTPCWRFPVVQPNMQHSEQILKVKRYRGLSPTPVSCFLSLKAVAAASDLRNNCVEFETFYTCTSEFETFYTHAFIRMWKRVLYSFLTFLSPTASLRIIPTNSFMVFNQSQRICPLFPVVCYCNQRHNEHPQAHIFVMCKYIGA